MTVFLASNEIISSSIFVTQVSISIVLILKLLNWYLINYSCWWFYSVRPYFIFWLIWRLVSTHFPIETYLSLTKLKLSNENYHGYEAYTRHTPLCTKSVQKICWKGKQAINICEGGGEGWGGKCWVSMFYLILLSIKKSLIPKYAIAVIQPLLFNPLLK